MTPYELRVKRHYAARGYKVLRNGYPDFLCYDPKRNDAILVEVKGRSGPLSKEQKLMHDVLKKLGLNVKVIRVSDNKILEEVPSPISAYFSKLGKNGYKAKVKKLLSKSKVDHKPKQ
jgi:hypothetical protein